MSIQFILYFCLHPKIKRQNWQFILFMLIEIFRVLNFLFRGLTRVAIKEPLLSMNQEWLK